MIADMCVKLDDVREMLASAGMISDGEYSGYCTEDICLEKLPTFEAEPVVHGHWIHKNGNTICSHCGSKELGDRPRCSSCGAWMDEKDVAEMMRSSLWLKSLPQSGECPRDTGNAIVREATSQSIPVRIDFYDRASGKQQGRVLCVTDRPVMVETSDDAYAEIS